MVIKAILLLSAIIVIRVFMIITVIGLLRFVLILSSNGFWCDFFVIRGTRVICVVLVKRVI
jgi:hypothetical protein